MTDKNDLGAMVRFYWEGKPRGKPVPRFNRGRAWYPEWYDGYKEEIGLAAKMSVSGVFAGPVALSVTFAIPIPKSWPKYRRAKMEWSAHAQKPDIDNLVKALLDAVTGIMFEDDRQVYSISADKLWTGGGGYILARWRGRKNKLC